MTYYAELRYVILNLFYLRSEQVPQMDVVLVPVGGCGLIAGVSLAIKTLNPSTEASCVLVYVYHVFIEVCVMPTH